MNMGLFLIIQIRVSEIVKIVLKIQEKSGEKNYNVDVCACKVSWIKDMVCPRQNKQNHVSKKQF
jgi:hypothetical protein